MSFPYAVRWENLTFREKFVREIHSQSQVNKIP